VLENGICGGEPEFGAAIAHVDEEIVSHGSQRVQRVVVKVCGALFFSLSRSRGSGDFTSIFFPRTSKVRWPDEVRLRDPVAEPRILRAAGRNHGLCLEGKKEGRHLGSAPIEQADLRRLHAETLGAGVGNAQLDIQPGMPMIALDHTAVDLVLCRCRWFLDGSVPLGILLSWLAQKHPRRHSDGEDEQEKYFDTFK
jgi:hypothetical protein